MTLSSQRTLSLVFFLAAVLIFSACKTRTVAPYVSPRITGRVVSVAGRSPLARVLVTRGSHKADLLSESRKGGEIMMQDPGVRTDKQGRFTLDSERALTPFRSGWHSVQLSFQLSGYEPFRTNYSILSPGLTNSLSGEPLLETGDITLTPVDRTAPRRVN
jgi:hypothetical protein